MATEELDKLGEKIIEGFELSDDDLRSLLSLESEEELEKLYYVARRVRDHYFGNKVFLNCFIYFSTHCKNQCAFCYYNCKNEINRYRLTGEEVKEMCKALKGAGFHMIDLTMGEDPYYYDDPDRFVELIRIVKEELGLPIMISPGVIDNNTLLKARKKGQISSPFTRRPMTANFTKNSG